MNSPSPSPSQLIQANRTGSRQASPRPEVLFFGMQFPARPDSCQAARHLVRDVLDRWGRKDDADTAELVVSELVGNTLRHTASTGVRLRMRALPAGLLLEVEDDDPTPVPGPPPAALGPPAAGEALAESGRGLALIVHHAARCGQRPRPAQGPATGKSVWVLLPAATPRQPSQQSS